MQTFQKLKVETFQNPKIGQYLFFPGLNLTFI